MKEFVIELLQAVATAAVPVCAAFLVQFLRRKSEQIGAQIDSLDTKELLAEVTEAVTTAVTYTSQTYVDALKASGNFTKENQEEALKKAVEQAERLLTAEARSFLEKAYGDLNAYLVSKIEAEVRVQKQQGNTVTLGEPFTAELKEAPDVTTVAAATAAATAAAVVQNAIPQASPASAPDRPQEGAEAPAV